MPLRLKVVSSQQKRLGASHVREFAACGGSIGRGADNDWVLPDAKRYVSSRHAMIDYQAGAYYLVDTSRNGVFVNGDDTAVGRGHPQRLFDGDRIRMGEYELAVEIVPGDEDKQDDGMRDSVVRAQLVPVDESVEVQLVDERKLTDSDALERHLAQPESSALVREIKAKGKVQGSRPVTHIGQVAPPADPAIDQFFAAAGLKPEDLRGSDTAEVLQTAGQLLRELLNGLADLLQSRARMKEELRLPHTIIQPGNNNPLKFSPGVSEALRYLLGDRGESYLPPEQAVRAAFNDVRIHQQALFKAMAHAVRDFGERFDPEELRSRFDRGLKRSPLLAGANKLRYWELYEEAYQAFMAREADAILPQVVSDEFVRAYEQEAEALRHARPPGGRPRPASTG
jgi:predicted component of type VI protein secretion system